MKISLLMNTKMPIFLGIFIDEKFSCSVEHEKKFYNLGARLNCLFPSSNSFSFALSERQKSLDWSLGLGLVTSVQVQCDCGSIVGIFFFYLNFTALSRIFHLYRADHSSKVGERRRKTICSSTSRTWLSHM